MQPKNFKYIMATLCDDFLSLHQGFKINDILITAHLAWSTMDTEAKSKFQNLGGSNAYYGCWYCLNRGVYTDR